MIELVLVHPVAACFVLAFGGCAVANVIRAGADIFHEDVSRVILERRGIARAIAWHDQQAALADVSGQAAAACWHHSCATRIRRDCR